MTSTPHPGPAASRWDPPPQRGPRAGGGQHVMAPQSPPGAGERSVEQGGVQEQLPGAGGSQEGDPNTGREGRGPTDPLETGLGPTAPTAPDRPQTPGTGWDPETTPGSGWAPSPRQGHPSQCHPAVPSSSCSRPFCCGAGRGLQGSQPSPGHAGGSGGRGVPVLCRLLAPGSCWWPHPRPQQAPAVSPRAGGQGSCPCVPPQQGGRRGLTAPPARRASRRRGSSA